MICYHGTNTKAAQSILETGFRVGTWFALHLEDAVTHGGPHVFEVVFEDSKFNGKVDWQFHVLIPIPKEKIISYKVCGVQDEKVLFRL